MIKLKLVRHKKDMKEKLNMVNEYKQLFFSRDYVKLTIKKKNTREQRMHCTETLSIGYVILKSFKKRIPTFRE